MLWWSWGTWPDVLIDFGRELYIPWQLSQGQVLYRDVAHFNGPLSQYWNALLFKLFGVSLMTVVVGNLFVLGAVLALLYRLLVAVGSRVSATVACLTFVLLFAFGQFTFNGNGNFVCPYSHEVTHGVLLALAGMTFVWAYARRGAAARERSSLSFGVPPSGGLPLDSVPPEGGTPNGSTLEARPRDAAAAHRLVFVVLAGLAAGLAFLTKVEVSLAAMAATTVGLALAVWSEDAAQRKPLRVAALYFGAMLLPPLVAFVALRTAMPAGQALAGTLGSWGYAFNRELSGNEYYKRGLGLLNVEESLGLLWKWTLRYAAALVASAALAFYVPKTWRTRLLIAAGVFAVVACALGLDWWQYHLEQTLRTLPNALRPLPLVVLVLGIVQARQFLGARTDPEKAGQLGLRIAMLVFAFAMLLKMLLHARIFHYGFALAMPAVMMMAIAVFGWLPAWVERRGGSGLVFAAGVMGVWAVAVATHLYVCHLQWSLKNCRVSQGADAFLSDGRGPLVRGPYVNAVLAEIAKRLEPGGTLAVFPEGEMLNYLARRRSPTPFIKFAPPEVIMFHEARILAAFRAHPPDLIVLVHKDTAEYGFPLFGQDYGCDIWRWITANYRPVCVFGAPPLQNPQQRFGIAILVPKPPAHPASNIPH